MLKNRSIVYIKRIIKKKMYHVMLLCILLLTTIYILLPEKNKEASIKVAIYIEDTSSNSVELTKALQEANSLYRFTFVDNKNDMIEQVKIGNYECAYYIPEGFFDCYIAGDSDSVKITRYNLKSSKVSPAITETLFSFIFDVCSEEILIYVVDMEELNEQLSVGLSSYKDSDEIFSIENVNDSKYEYENFIYKVTIPIYELCVLLLIFSSLLGYHMFLTDSEKGTFIALNKKDKFQIKMLSIILSIVPILLTGLICVGISYFSICKLINVFGFGILSISATFILSFIIRKSTMLNKVLPLIMLLSIMTIFLVSI